MNKRKFWLIGLVIVALVIIGRYYVVEKAPSDFLKEEAMIKEMNNYEKGYNVQHVKAIIPVDERHYVVPYTTIDNVEAMAFWEWRYAKWNLIQLSTEPILRWQLDPKDYRSSYIVWNRSAEEVIPYTTALYAQREFRISWGEPFYSPQLLVKEEIQLGEYGIWAIPKEWQVLMHEKEKSAYVNRDFFNFTNEVSSYKIVAAYLDESSNSSNLGSRIIGKSNSVIDFLFTTDLDKLQ